MPARPCAARHPDPTATAAACHLCLLATTRGDYQRLWGEAVTAPVPRPERGHQSHVGHCSKRNAWDWWVKRDGDVIAQGSEPTEAEARAEVAAWLPPVEPGAHRLEVTADGIGDHLVGLAVATGWRAAHPGQPLTFIGKPWCVPWVDLFDWPDVATSVDARLPDAWPAGASRGGGHFVEAAARAPWWGLPTPRPLPDDAVAWAAEYRRCVVLSPFALASGSSRDWLPSHWRVLAAELRAEGRRVVAIGSAADAPRLAPFGEHLAGLPPARVAALMRESAAVVGNESGMAHLAGALSVPCVVLAAQLDGGKVHGFWPFSTVIQGPLPCSGCRWTGPNHRPHCDQVCASLQAITPEAVLSSLRQYLDCEWFPDPELRGHLGKLLVPRTDRRGTMGAFLKQILREQYPRVVETGCQRQERDYGAGMSTTLIGRALRGTGGGLTSLDNDPEHVALARRVASGLPVDVVETDSVAWLRAYHGEPLSGLYLDSLDADRPGHAEHCLAEAEAALPHLGPTAAVLIDDTPRDGDGWAGKGRLAVPMLLAAGWRVAAQGYQTLLVRP